MLLHKHPLAPKIGASFLTLKGKKMNTNNYFKNEAMLYFSEKFNLLSFKNLTDETSELHRCNFELRALVNDRVELVFELDYHALIVDIKCKNWGEVSFINFDKISEFKKFLTTLRIKRGIR